MQRTNQFLREATFGYLVWQIDIMLSAVRPELDHEVDRFTDSLRHLQSRFVRHKVCRLNAPNAELKELSFYSLLYYIHPEPLLVPTFFFSHTIFQKEGEL